MTRREEIEHKINDWDECAQCGNVRDAGHAPGCWVAATEEMIRYLLVEMRLMDAVQYAALNALAEAEALVISHEGRIAKTEADAAAMREFIKGWALYVDPKMEPRSHAEITAAINGDAGRALLDRLAEAEREGDRVTTLCCEAEERLAAAEAERAMDRAAMEKARDALDTGVTCEDDPARFLNCKSCQAFVAIKERLAAK